MADDNLKIDEETLTAQITNIKEAIDNYTSFATDPFSEEIEGLETMNTDFIAKFKVMLDDLNEDNSTVIEALEEISGLTEEILQTFQKIDDDAVSSMGFNREG